VRNKGTKLALVSFFLGIGVAGVLALLGNTIPAIVVLSVFIIIGLVLLVWGLSQKDIDIVAVVVGVHDIRAMYVENQIKVNPLDITDIEAKYQELMGIDTSNNSSVLLSAIKVLSELKDKKTDNVESQVSLVHVGKLMDRYQKGVDTLTGGDERYIALMADYNRWCKCSKNSEKRMAIYNYLLESYGMNSQWLYTGSLMRKAPEEIMQMLPEMFNSYMDGYKEYMKTYLGKWIDKYNSK